MKSYQAVVIGTCAVAGLFEYFADIKA